MESGLRMASWGWPGRGARRPVRVQRRLRRGFLWWPRTINGKTRWLCFAAWEQEYCARGYCVRGYPRRGWVDACWVTVRGAFGKHW